MSVYCYTSYPAPTAVTLQCGECMQRVSRCPGCGAGFFVIVSCARPPPTAFDLFYRDEDAARGPAAAGECPARRRAIAEAWLAADEAARASYEAAAAAIAAPPPPSSMSKSPNALSALSALSKQTEDDAATRVERAVACAVERKEQRPRSSRPAPKKKSPVVARRPASKKGRASEPKPRTPPTAYGLFSKQHRKIYDTIEKRMAAWSAMSTREKKPYDDKAAALRVAFRR